MDTFHGYNNILGFFIGNENIAKKEDSVAAPFLKAAARDMKAYRDSKGYRKIPIGYSAADIQQLRPMLQDYLTCGDNSSEIVDFFGLNSYSWCDPSTFEQSTYDKLQQFAKDFPVPIFLSETGCIIPGPRKWDDQDAIFSKPMVNDWSGAIIYEWIQEQNNYGIITYGPPAGDSSQMDEAVEDGFTRKGTPTPRSPDFGNLKTKWASLQPTGVSKADYDPKHVSTRDCPKSTEGGWWQVDGNVQLPTIGASLEAGSGPTATISSKSGHSSASGAEPSATGPSKGGDGGDKDGSDKDKDEKNVASSDRHITTIGAGLVGLVLMLALKL